MSEYVYDPKKCTEVLEFDCPDDILLRLALEAHRRDITLNHLLNEIFVREADRVLERASKEQQEHAAQAESDTEK